MTQALVRPRLERTRGVFRERLGAGWIALGLVLAACDGGGGQPTPENPEEKRDPLTGLTDAESKEVLARVGDRTITLGEYAVTLTRMGKYERLRYQSPERQKELLDEMIRLELLSREAVRCGLDQDPEVQLRITEALRDEVLEDLRRSLPKPEELTEREVREYYDAHESEFQEPERRRPLVIVLGSRAAADRVATEAQGATGAAWGELARKHSLDKKGLGPTDALEWAGDRGFVSAPGEKRGENADVPEEVRAAVFKLEKLGDVAATAIESGARFYVVRLGGTSPARERSVADADRTIRVELIRQKFLEKERELEAELRKKYPIAVDEAAIAELAKKRDAAVKDAPKKPSTPPKSP